MSSPNDTHRAFHFKTYTVTTTEAVPITTTVDGKVATKATISVLGDAVYMRWDGLGDPTPNDGHYLASGFQRVLDGHENLDQLKIIAVNNEAKVAVTLEERVEE